MVSTTYSNRPSLKEIKNEEIRTQLTVTGIADVESWRKLIERARSENDQAAEAIASYGLGYYLDLKKDFTDAVLAYSRSLELYPNWIEAIFNRGVARSQMHDYEEAIQDYDKVEWLLNEIRSVESSSERANLAFIRGKLLLFRAECRIELGRTTEFTIARDEILQSQYYLGQVGPLGDRWLKQIRNRLQKTYDKPSLVGSFGAGLSSLMGPKVPKMFDWIGQHKVREGVWFFVGILAAIGLVYYLWSLVPVAN